MGLRISWAGSRRQTAARSVVRTEPVPASHVSSGGGAVVVTRHAEQQPSWTVLGRRMGFTSARRQREQILTAIDTMTWADADPTLHLDGAVGAVIAAVLGHHRDRLRRIGLARLGAGTRLIGLQDDRGTRRFVLDLHSEAIYVLATTARHRTARPDAA